MTKGTFYLLGKKHSGALTMNKVNPNAYHRNIRRNPYETGRRKKELNHFNQKSRTRGSSELALTKYERIIAGVMMSQCVKGISPTATRNANTKGRMFLPYNSNLNHGAVIPMRKTIAVRRRWTCWALGTQ